MPATPSLIARTLAVAVAALTFGCTHPVRGPSQAEIDDYARMERAAATRAKPDGSLRLRDAWDPETYGKEGSTRPKPVEPPIFDRPFGPPP